MTNLDDRHGPVSRALAEFLTDTSFDDLPSEVVSRTKLYVIDQIGLMLGLSGIRTPQRASQYARAGAPGASTVIGHGFRVEAERAAFANGVAGHGLELDDTHMPSLNHPGCMVVAAGLAVAEERSSTGSELLEAIALGYEIMGRVGRGMGQEWVYGHGFHPVGVLGPIGAACAAAKLLGADPWMALHAIGISASQAAGTLEYNQTWGETTRLHAGFAAMAGIRSAMLAQLGIPGPGAPLEGKYGFARVHSRQLDFDAMTSNLGADYTLLVNSFKVRPYHGMVHNAVDVTIEALDRAGRRITEADIDLLESVTIGLCEAGVRGIVEGDPPDRLDESMTALNFSLPMPLAHAILTHGAMDAVLDFEGVTPAIERLSQKVTGVLDEECEAAYREGVLLATVEIRFTDGEPIAWKNYRKGSTENPATDDELYDKFLALSGRALADNRSRRLLELLQDLEAVADIDEFRALLLDARSRGVAAQ